ncbi:hypothetical protein [Coxiella burnetii]
MEIVAKTIIDFAKENKYPIQELNKTQKKEIKLNLDNALLIRRRGVAEIISSWNLKDKTLEVWLRDHLESRLSRMQGLLKESPSWCIPEILYDDLFKQLEKIKGEFDKREKAQKKLNESYTKLEETFAQKWNTFEKSWEAVSATEGIREIKEQLKEAIRFPEMPLSYYSEFWRKKRNYQSLFEYAVLLYNSKKRVEDKEALRPLIEIVIQHGDKPSPKFQGNIAWPILRLLVKYVNNSTHYGGDVRQQLWEYSEGQKDVEEKPWYKFSVSKWLMGSEIRIKQQRRSDVQAYIMLLCYEREDRLDQLIGAAIQKKEAVAERKKTSDLYRRLREVNENAKAGQYIMEPLRPLQIRGALCPRQVEMVQRPTSIEFFSHAATVQGIGKEEEKEVAANFMTQSS